MNYTEVPLFWINRLSFLSRRALTRRFLSAGHKVSPEEWAILLVLWATGPRSPSGLSDETIKDRSTVTRLIDAMVRKGLVVRRENPDDRRRSDITLTPLGEQMKFELVPIAMELIAQTTSGVPAEDIEITLRTMRVFAENLTALDKKP